MFGAQQRRRDAAAKAETLAEEQRLRLLEKEKLAEANRVEVACRPPHCYSIFLPAVLPMLIQTAMHMRKSITVR